MMTEEVSVEIIEVEVEVVAPLSAGKRLQFLAFAATPVFLVGLAAPYLGLIGLPIVFFLKNKLHLSSNEVAMFSAIAAIPLFLGWVFGFIRDRWSPLGAGDRGHLVVFGLAGALAYAALAFAPPTYAVLLTGGLIITALIQFVFGAANGLASAAGKHHAMSGQMSTALNIASNAPAALAFLLGGVLAGVLEKSTARGAAQVIFLLGAALMAAIAVFAMLAPRRLFDEARQDAPELPPAGDILRLLKAWPIYPALLIQLLWQFGPGAGIALQFHLANEIHASDAQVGMFFTIFYSTFLPVYLLYGWLAQRYSLRTLLWWGGVLAVPQMVSLLFIHTPQGALLAAIPMGLLGGMGQAAFTDLAIRSCPKGLEGTMMMLLWTMYWIAVRGGDLWGTDLYDHHGGFNTALWATIAVYAAILPVLLFVPRRITAGRDARA